VQKFFKEFFLLSQQPPKKNHKKCYELGCILSSCSGKKAKHCCHD